MNLPSIDLSCLCKWVVLFLLSFNFAYAQQIEGKVLDEETGETLPFAHIVLQGKQVGVVAGVDGTFKIPFSFDTSDSLVISHVGYQPEVIPISQGTSDLTVRLKVRTDVLQEVTVEPLTDPFEIFEQAVLEYQENRRKDPHIARAYYNEKVRLGGEIIFMAESVGFSVFGGDSSKFTPLARQNFFCDLTRLQYKENWKGYGSNEPMPPLGNYVAGNFLMYIENYGLLSFSEYQSYKVDFEKEQPVDGYLLSFSGNGEKGVITLTDDFSVLSITYDKTRKIWTSIFNRRISGEAEVSYMYFDGVPFLKNARISYVHGNGRFTLTYHNLLQKLDRFKASDDRLSALQRYARNPLIRYDEDEWNAYEIPYDTDFASSDIREQTIKKHMGKAYYEDKGYDQTALELMKALRGLF